MSKFCIYLLLLALLFDVIVAPRSRTKGGGGNPSKSKLRHQQQNPEINYIFDLKFVNVPVKPDAIILYNIFIICEDTYRRYGQKDRCSLEDIITINAFKKERKCSQFKISIIEAGNTENGDFHSFQFECPDISADSNGNGNHHYKINCDLKEKCICIPKSENYHSERVADGVGTSTSAH